MQKISDMSLEELQDYCVKQAEQIQSLQDSQTQQNTKITELTELNHALQQRNNQLFRQVEQGVLPDDTNAQQGTDEPPTPTCEEFASKLKGVIRK